MHVVEIEGLKELDKFIAKMQEGRAVYANAQKKGSKRLFIDWHAKPLPGGTPKVTRIEIKVTNE